MLVNINTNNHFINKNKSLLIKHYLKIIQIKDYRKDKNISPRAWQKETENNETNSNSSVTIIYTHTSVNKINITLKMYILNENIINSDVRIYEMM